MTKPTLHFQRFEFKYFLPRHLAKQLVAALLPHMEWDPYIKQSQGFYRVNSLYFDSPDYACFWDKEAGVADRKKLRLRYYGESLTPETPVFAGRAPGQGFFWSRLAKKIEPAFVRAEEQ